MREKSGRWFKLLDWFLPPITHLHETSGDDEPVNLRPLVNVSMLLCNLLTNLTLLLTFGLMFPPLAVMLLAAITATVFQAKLDIIELFYLLYYVCSVHRYRGGSYSYYYLLLYIPGGPQIKTEESKV
jgi:hypothetical protein